MTIWQGASIPHVMREMYYYVNVMFGVYLTPCLTSNMPPQYHRMSLVVEEKDDRSSALARILLQRDDAIQHDLVIGTI